MVCAVKRVALPAVLALCACGDNLEVDTWPFYSARHETEVGSISLDHLDATSVQPVLDRFDIARDDGTVVMLYAHVPGKTVSMATIEAALAHAREMGLASYTFRDLARRGPSGAGFCLSFDDEAIDAWYGMRDLLARYGAHVSFFVTRYPEWTADGRAKLHQLELDGHSIEAHGLHHRNARDYVAAHGMDAWIADEVQPSIDVLRADGFDPVAFAFPFGAHTAEMEDALVPKIPISRVISETPR
jgi:hypothetical protein